MNEQYKGYNITVTEDDCGVENPRDWMTPDERAATFVLSHKRYTVPCEVDVDFDDYNGWDELAKAIVPKGYVVKYVRWYEHSGISVSLVDSADFGGFDVGCAGIVFGKTEDDINSEFEPWAQYVEGDVWDYLIEDEDGEVVDSLGGIFGYDYAVQEAKDFIDSYVAPRKVAKPATAYHK